MGYISVNNVFTSSTLCNANHVNENFNSITNGLADGNKNVLVNTITAGEFYSKKNITIGTSTGSTCDFNAVVYTDILPFTSGYYTLGSALSPIPALYLDNGSIDGGSINFNSNSNKNIESNQSGTILSFYNFDTGIKYAADGYLRMGTGSDLELTISSDNGIIRNRTTDKNMGMYVTSSATDVLMFDAHGNSSCVYQRSFLDGLEVNTIINGGMLIWQRATTFTAIATNAFFADRYKYIKSGTMVQTVSRATLISSEEPYLEGYRYAAMFQNTTSQAVISGSHYCGFLYVIEGYDMAPFYGKECNISFWIKSSKTGNYSVSLVNSGITTIYNHPFTVSGISSWEQKTFSFTVPSYSASTWTANNTKGMDIGVFFAGGSSFATDASNTWTTVPIGVRIDSNQVNAVEAASYAIYFTGLRMGLRDTFNTMNQSLNFITELDRCERYYHKTYNYSDTVGATSITYANFKVAFDVNNFYRNTIKGKKTIRPGFASTNQKTYAPVNGVSGSVNTPAGAVKAIVQYTVPGERNYNVSGANTFAVLNIYTYHSAVESEDL